MTSINLTPEQVAVLNQITAEKKALEEKESLLMRFAVGSVNINPADVESVEFTGSTLVVKTKAIP